MENNNLEKQLKDNCNNHLDEDKEYTKNEPPSPINKDLHNVDDNNNDQKEEDIKNDEDKEQLDDDNKPENPHFMMSDEQIENLLKACEELKSKANKHFQQKEYLEAMTIYAHAIKQIIEDYSDDLPPYHLSTNMCDSRFHKLLSVLFMNRGLSFKFVNEKEKALDMFSKSLIFNIDNGKSLYQRLELLYDKGEYLEAQEDYQKLKSTNSSLLYEFKVSEYTLNFKAEQKKKEMTDQMMGQLKDVGNSFLGLFGLSTDNFNLQQQPGGGYNIQFKN